MKRLLAVMLLACMGSVGCGNRSTPVESTTTTAALQPATSAPSAARETISDAVSEPPAETSETPNVSEMDDAEPVAEPTAGAQPLALRIAEARPVPASEFREGVHYTRLVPAQPSSGSVEQVDVTEAFWYGCSHCYALDSYLENWRKQAPAYVKFVRVPVIWNPRTGTHARLFYTAEALGKLEALHPQIFREIHVNNNPLDSATSIEVFFTARGVSREEFTRTFSSGAVGAKLSEASELLQRYRIESVPTLVINGKYVTDVGRAGGQKQLISLLNELVAREHGV